MLTIDRGKVARIVEQARMFDAKEEVSDPDSGSNASDDGMVDVLEDLPEDSTKDELMECIRGLNEDEQADLVALAWIGRGTYEGPEFEAAVSEARRAHNSRTAEYLISLPMLGDYLEEGLYAVEEAEAANFDKED